MVEPSQPAHGKPYRHAPLLWRNYQDALLPPRSAAIRAGATTEADSLLARLPEHRKAIAARMAGLPADEPWSLAVLEKSAASLSADPLRSDVVNKTKALEKALEELIRAPKAATELSAAEVRDSAIASVPMATGQSKTKTNGEAPSPAVTIRHVTELPELIEAQVLHWAQTYTEQVGNVGTFYGVRGERLKEAQRVRSSPKSRRTPTTEPTNGSPRSSMQGISCGQAQDRLFVNDKSSLEAIGPLLERARAWYREAIGVGGRVANALDLVEEIESELPDYGEWQVRRREGDVTLDLGTDMLAVITTTAALAAKVQAPPSDPSRDDDGLAAHLDRVKAIDSLVREARLAFDRLRSLFNVECESLQASAGGNRWRELDAVLRVPTILPEQRRVLLDRIQSTEVASGLNESLPSLDDQSIRDIEAADASSTAPDRYFWREAVGLAFLEIGLLEIGGAPESRLEGLRTTLTAARAALNNGLSDGFADMLQVAELIRAARHDQMESASFRHDRSSDFATLVAADRAFRVALVAETRDRVDLACDEIQRCRRHEQLLWHGNRLLADFDPDRARRLFKAASLHSQSKALTAALNAANNMDQAGLIVTAEAVDPFQVSAQSEPLRVRVSAIGPVPSGQLAVQVMDDSFEPLMITEKASQRDARDGVLVDLGGVPARDNRPLAFVVARSEPGPTLVGANILPRVFYRGHIASVDPAVAVRLLPVKDPVSITIRQSYLNLPDKSFADQFKEHPGQGYLHYGTNLQYKLILKAEMPVRAVVRYGLKDHAKSFKEEIVELDPKKPSEIHGVVKGDDFLIERAGEKFVIPPLNLEVAVSRDRASGAHLGQARYTFRNDASRRVYRDKIGIRPDPASSDDRRVSPRERQSDRSGRGLRLDRRTNAESLCTEVAVGLFYFPDPAGGEEGTLASRRRNQLAGLRRRGRDAAAPAGRA